MKMATLLERIGGPNYKQVAKKIMGEYNLPKPVAVTIAKNLIDYDHKKKRMHPMSTLQTITDQVNESFEQAGVNIYLEAA